MAKVVRLPTYRQVIGYHRADKCGRTVVEARWGRGWRLKCLRCGWLQRQEE